MNKKTQDIFVIIKNVTFMFVHLLSLASTTNTHKIFNIHFFYTFCYLNENEKFCSK